MSSFWNKLNSIAAKDDKSDKNLSETHCFTNIRTPTVSINTSDEENILKDLRNGFNVELSIKSQIVQNFEALMEGGLAFSYFLDFLRNNEVDHYAHCYVECENYKKLCNYIVNFISAEQPDPSEPNGKFMAKCGLTGQIELNNACDCNIKELGDTGKTDKICSNLLPDLVKNMPVNSSLTPLPSPDDIPCCAISQSTDTIADLPSYEKCQNTKNLLNANVRTLKSGNTESFLSNSLDDLSIDNWIFKLKKLKLQICDKYINDQLELIEISSSVINNILYDAESSENVLNCDLFIPIQKKIYMYLEKDYYHEFLKSDYFLKFQVDVFTNKKFGLQDLLSCDTALPYFIEYMEQEGAQSLIEFWMSIYNFKKHLEQAIPSNGEHHQADAMILYDKYFSLQATHPVGFSDQVRFLVESSICQDGGPSSRCFDIPLKIVLQIFNKNYLPGYLSSSLHIKFVSELINNLGLNTYRRKTRLGSSSTCSSEHSAIPSDSISRRNTLLASDSSLHNVKESGNKILKNLEERSLSLRIDSTQILDPDLLWRRKNFTKLSCGYVDELGRFESDLQPEPDRKSEFNLSQKLKKFVQVKEKKVKEDMAYKIAEMIIKDVTNITLKDSKERIVPTSHSDTELSNLHTKIIRSSSEIFSSYAKSVKE